MSIESALPDTTRAHLDEIRGADILVGIPSYNNAQTIGHVVEQAARGMVEHFPDMKPVLLNSDGGSSDGTAGAVLTASCPSPVTVLSTPYRGLPGKGSALHAIFEATVLLGCRVCVVVDSDLRSITPDWIRLLAEPIVGGSYDYVTPYYVRHKYDGTITNNIAYPMTRALYGWDIRQPIGGDFGLSGELAATYCHRDVWNGAVARFGIDIWMTTTAINEGFRPCQARLGAKIHDVKDPAAALGPMFRQVLGSLFSLMKTYAREWLAAGETRRVPILGPPAEAEPTPVEVSLPAMLDKLRQGAQRCDALWKAVLADENRQAVLQRVACSDDRFTFPADLWVKCVYDFAIAYCNARGPEADKIVDAMTPLYYGRTAGFVGETWNMNSAQAEEVVQAQARTFERLKPYLLSRWKTSIR